MFFYRLRFLYLVSHLVVIGAGTTNSCQKGFNPICTIFLFLFYQSAILLPNPICRIQSNGNMLYKALLWGCSTFCFNNLHKISHIIPPPPLLLYFVFHAFVRVSGHKSVWVFILLFSKISSLNKWMDLKFKIDHRCSLLFLRINF